MNNSKPCPKIRKLKTLLYLITLITIFYEPAKGQEKPPKPIAVTVSTLQHLNFGTFIQSGIAGTVTVDHSGFRSSTGDIILPNISSIVSPALFEITALPGTLITIANGTDIPLIGSHGGSMILSIGPSSTGSPFVTVSPNTNVFIGGTLTVGPFAANPSGDYNGTFTVNFIQN